MLINHHYACHFSSKLHFYVHNPPRTCAPEYLEKRQFVFVVMPHPHLSNFLPFLKDYLKKNVSKMFANPSRKKNHLAISRDWKRGHMTCPASAVSQLFAKELFPAFRVIMLLVSAPFPAFWVQRVNAHTAPHGPWNMTFPKWYVYHHSGYIWWEQKCDLLTPKVWTPVCVDPEGMDPKCV